MTTEAGASAGQSSATSAGIDASTGTGGKSFVDSLPEDIRGEASLANFKDVGGLAKSYLHANKLVGSSLRIPGDDASDEVKSDFIAKMSKVAGVAVLPKDGDAESEGAFYNKLGRPESPDKYSIGAEEGIDAVALGQFKEVAHKLGLTDKQAKEVFNFELQREQGMIQQQLAHKEANKAVLQKEWGKEYNNRLEGINNLLEVFGQKYPDQVASLKSSPALNNASLLIMLSELGKMYTESGVISGAKGVKFGTTAEEARDQIQDILHNRSKFSSAYWNDRDAGHEAAVEKMRELNRLANPDAG